MAALDFASSLYLGLQHGSRDLSGWDQLTLGKPAALDPVPGTAATESGLAALTGCDRALLATSTLHLFWDLFAMLARRKVNIFLDAGSYPILRWGVERAAALGTPVRTFRRHDEVDLQRVLASTDTRPPVIVADGYCPSCSSHGPIASYVTQARKRGGLVVVDDSQALGIFGKPSPWIPYGTGGGGSMRRAALNGNDSIVIGASLAKAFGAPVAMLAGRAAMVNEFERQSATRVHCSPPSVVAIAAAARALAINRRSGDTLRLKLAWLVLRFRQGLMKLGLQGTAGLFPLQTLALPKETTGAREIHAALRNRGIEAVLHRGENTHEARISFVITARHSAKQIDEALAGLADVMAHVANRECEGSYGR